MVEENKPALKDWMVLMALVLTWGSSFILIKKGLIGFSNIQVGLLRVSISFLVLLPFAIRRARFLTKKNFHLFLIAGLLGNAIPAFLFATAQTRLDSYMAGTLNSLTPLFTLIFGIWFFNRQARWINILGVITGFLGAAGLLYFAGGKNFSLEILPGLLVIMATMCYALQMNFIKNYLTGYDPITIASLAFTFIGIPSLIILFLFTDFSYRIVNESQSLPSLGFIAILSVFGTALAIIANFWIIKRTSALFASSVTYLMPVVSIFWGIIDGEFFRLSYLFWIGIIILGVYMANRPVVREKPITL